MATADFGLATGVDSSEKLQAVDDDRSSSLSELGDRAGMERSSRAGSEANDTEAETERLENSPQKQRRQRDMVLTSTNGTYGGHHSQPVAGILPGKGVSLGSDGEKFEQTSCISSLEDSGEESGKDSSPLSVPMKRKRSSFEEDSANDRDTMRRHSPKAMKLNDNRPAEASARLVVPIPPDVSAVDRDLQVIADIAMVPSNEEQPVNPQALPKQKHRKGKRKSKRTPNDEPTNAEHAGSGGESTAEHGGNAEEATYSYEEDAQTENMAEGVEAENPIQVEELVEKKSAMDSLSAIEKWFARLRDKIYEERIAQCNQELAVLEQPLPTHPELLAMKEVIDQRRDQKIEYENDLMKFRLMTLQRESVANKAQAHSQYMQTVREIRDSYLESLNRKYYQIQRERRSCDGDVPDYMYTFTTKRSQQITHQAAYNTEVSILAGVAKYVGFPSAPEIGSARPKEIDDDFRSMGIAVGAAQNAQNHRAALRTNLSAVASFPRQRPGAEEHFLEQNPWANPQHPAHRQVSGLSGAVTRSSTPAGQRRLLDLAEPHGSASTIVEAQSGPNSSMAPTPATGEAPKLVQSGRKSEMSESFVDSTPSRLVNGSLLDSDLALQDSSRDKTDKKDSPTLPKNLSMDSQTPSVLPKPLPFMQTGSSTPGFRTSSPVRYPAFKAEDAGVSSRRSPMPHQFHRTAPVSTTSDGRANRFAA